MDASCNAIAITGRQDRRKQLKRRKILYCHFGALYQICYVPNIPPHSNTRVGETGKDERRGFGSYELGSSQRLSEDLLQLKLNAEPSILPEAPSKDNLQLEPTARDCPKIYYITLTHSHTDSKMVS
jgi:hypothetical protein